MCQNCKAFWVILLLGYLMIPVLSTVLGLAWLWLCFRVVEQVHSLL
jgi:hypothetical protein